MIKKKEWVILLLLPIAFLLICIFLKANFALMLFLSFGVLSSYLSYIGKIYIKSTFVFTVLMLPIILVIDMLTTLNGTWTVATSFFSSQFLGISNFENIFWGLLRMYSVVMFYRIFTKDMTRGILHIKTISFVTITLFVIFFICLKLYPTIMYIKSLYLLLGVFFGVIPICIFLLKYWKKIQKIYIPSLYFFYYCFFFEFTGMHLHNWSFTRNDYLAVFTFFHLVLPFEEVIWLLCGSGIIIAYFELLRDSS